jgi:hypothetical protein
MKKLVLLFLCLSNFSIGFTQDGYPKPTAKDILFYIQHNRGKNTFVYQPNYTSKRQLNDKEPIKISRQLFDHKGEIKPLTGIQRRYAYGLKTEKLGDNYYKIELVSYPHQKLYLKFDTQKKPFVEGTIAGKYIRINNLFIYLKENSSGLNTEAEYILFYGIDRSGKSVHAKLLP